jgi:hypothetical protein
MRLYPILYVDGIRIRVKDNGVVTINVTYLAVGVDSPIAAAPCRCRQLRPSRSGCVVILVEDACPGRKLGYRVLAWTFTPLVGTR